MRSAFLILLFGAVVSGCNCVKPPPNVEDGGEPPVPACVTEADCPLGDTCVEGQCVTPMTQDAATGCVADEDCPEGERCLRSAGLCVPVETDGGTTEEDAGVAGDCFEGQTQTCGTSKLGECRLGTQTCALVDGVYRFGGCLGAIDPVAELCNGLDDDCDGLADDGFVTASCGVGECARTVETCVGGMTIACTPGPASAEVCDGRDNDCNGTADDGIAALTCGVGACARTVAACANGTPQACSPGMPSLETCNGLDDNCNGQTDENLGNTVCGLGQCARSVAACTSGAPTACVPGPTATETCNTVDDDCDGLVDEGCACTDGNTQSCYTGTPGTLNVGVCRGGTQLCAGGQWGACNGQNTGAAETCDGADNDCDGQTDEGLGLITCGTGACFRSAPACNNGTAGTCAPGTAGTETCNNIDDDCDGTTDEDLGTVSCGVGICARTINVCAAGQTQTCMPGPTSTEVCNALDDDCDGAVDETFPLQGQACSTGLPGRCAAGTNVCTAGAVACSQTLLPIAEICSNGVDENCNNVVDDPTACGCNVNIDRDFDGSNECNDCNDLDGTIRPSATEVCNGKDDDCDLAIDEGFDVDADTFTSCGTRPGGGLDSLRRDCNDTNAFVFPGKVADCGNAATPNTANGVDDNCNGYTDETCACDTRDRDGDGFNECNGDCNDADAQVAPNRTEVCDGKDNDCNRATVDNCGVSQPCGVRSGPGYAPFAAGTDRCRPDLICVSNVSTGELTCGSFCNQTTGTGLNDSCQANEGCFRNLIDSANQHLCSVLTVGAKSTGATCAAGTECRTGDCATEGTTRYCSDKCTHEAGCSNNTSCVVQKQSFSNPPSVISYLYSYCRLDSLVTGTRTTGQACTATGGECRAGVDACVNGRCTEPCCQHGDCATGYACNVAGPRVNTGYASGGQPIVSVVPSCIASTAVRVSGAACAANSECKSGICDRTMGICVDLCCNDTSCPNGTTCEPITLRLSGGGTTFVRACLFAPYPAQIEQR